MKTFLQHVADTLKNDYSDWENLTVVFPNRRAGLYLRKAWAENLDTPRWSPGFLSIEEFIASFSTLKEVDKLSLIVTLYHSFKEVTHSDENLDHFYFWGEMLLRDFDELDKYMVNATALFRDLSNQKELDEHFDYLTDEQKKFLSDFWQTVSFSDSESKKSFLRLWQNLPVVYQEFKTRLLANKTGYGGMIHREVAESFQSPNPPTWTKGDVVFVGFNALTTAEEKIISWFVQNKKAKVFWDEDEFYVNAKHREAGTFFRQYREHNILGKTFSEVPTALLSEPKKMTIIGVPQRAGQPKLLGQQLEDALRASADLSAQENPGAHTLIVLPDESLLLPVLYALPPALKAINVTMGYSLVNTPYYSLIDFLFDLHLHKRKEEFYFRNVLALLNHPYLKALTGEHGTAWRKSIIDHNQISIPTSFFQVDGNEDAESKAEAVALMQLIFVSVAPHDFLRYIVKIIVRLATSAQADDFMEKEFAFHFHRVLSRVEELNASEPMELRMQQRLFRQIARSEKVPFTGEPLKGIQIMGVLETRNLDFDHVIVLSLNEGLWPASPRQSSYIPHTIRRAYNLPTSEHQDAMYAYLFYRLLQRAQQVDLYYNTEAGLLANGEMSRYLYQIIYETGWTFERKILYNPVQVHQPSAIAIEKKTDVLQKLERYFGKALTPSTLNTYLECRLKFYFMHVIEMKEPKEVEEETDARVFGNIVHKVMELFYLDIKPPAGEWHVRPEHFENLEVKLERNIERAYREHFTLNEKKKVSYEGIQLVVNEMVKKFTRQVLNLDKAHSPFVIELLEANYFTTTIPIDQLGKQLNITVGGKIDRVDRKENTVRIIDYKTGKDENSFKSIALLFDRNKERNKAAFQTMLYAWIYERRNNKKTKLNLQPGLFNRKEIFKNGFQYGLYLDKHRVEDVTPLLPEFETHFKTLLEEIFSVEQPFDQTDDTKTCSYCPYKEICSR